MSDGSGRESAVEAVKRESRGLRGTLRRALQDAETAAFDGDGYNLLKFHGIYQGYDRDGATERKRQGLGKQHQLMVRARIPGGRLTPAQYLALDGLAGRHADGTLRITTRQGIQLHGVVKRDLKPTIAAISHALLTTLAACGDVVRNVVTTPAPIRDRVHARLEADARALSAHLLPKTRAYHEIWLDGERIEGPEEEPLYGSAYLPRKFKIGLATPEDNAIDVLTNDLGIVALFEAGALAGYDFFLGGGLGITHNKPSTYPRLATPVAFVAPDDLLPAAAAVVKLHRDHGDRGNRKHARLKYIIAEKGEAWARARIEDYLGKALADPVPVARFHVVDHLGWHEQGDGRLFLGVPVASGRIADRGERRLRSALRLIVERFGGAPVLTPSQDILLGDIEPKDRAAIAGLLQDHGVAPAADLAPVRRWALACPALPTCGLALTEAERIREPLIDAIEKRLARHGLLGERLSIRITGCPNGCARPYAGDIGIVGRMPGFYSLYVGGDFEGTRLNEKLLDKVAQGDIADALEPLLALFATERRADEGFGDFCHRAGSDRLLAALRTARHQPAVRARQPHRVPFHPSQQEVTMTLQLGDTVPDFEAETTAGHIRFHEWLGGSWGVLFSHPKDFTPVCTTELGEVARLKPEFDRRNVKVIGLSVDPLSDHKAWAGDIAETQGHALNFPLVADPDRKISNLYGMIHPNASDTFTVRSVFVIGPDKKLKLSITYPASTGRNFEEILRVIDSLQLTARQPVATPVNWKFGEDVIIAPSLSDEEARSRFPQGWKTLKHYLRMVAQPGAKS